MPNLFKHNDAQVGGPTEQLERIQDHSANCINDLMPWAYQDMINARDAEAEAKDAA